MFVFDLNCADFQLGNHWPILTATRESAIGSV